MAGVFEVATRSAIEEIIVESVQESKYGFVMSHEALKQITDQLFDLFITSRNLKEAGDRIIASGGFPSSQSSKSRRPKSRL